MSVAELGLRTNWSLPSESYKLTLSLPPPPLTEIELYPSTIKREPFACFSQLRSPRETNRSSPLVPLIVAEFEPWVPTTWTSSNPLVSLRKLLPLSSAMYPPACMPLVKLSLLEEPIMETRSFPPPPSTLTDSNPNALKVNRLLADETPSVRVLTRSSSEPSCKSIESLPACPMTVTLLIADPANEYSTPLTLTSKPLVAPTKIESLLSVPWDKQASCRN